MVDIKKSPFFLSTKDMEWVFEKLQKLTLDEKIGQLFCPIGYSFDEAYLQNILLSKHIGGLMFRSDDKEKVYQTYSYLQSHSKVPLFLAANSETGGNGIVSEGTFFGQQMQIAATGETEFAYLLGKISCSEGAAVGCNFAFAPVVDIDMNYHNPITNVRTYGNDVDTIISCGRNYMKAATEYGTATAIKHFPGDGVDECDQHILTSINSLSCEEWDASFGKIYKTLIDAGSLAVMVGHIALPAYQKIFNPTGANTVIPASLSPELMNDLLRGQLGFNGLIISDATPMAGFCSAMSREKAVPYCIASGCDMFLFNKDLDEDYYFMKKGYENGILSEERLNEAVTRILAMKASMRLHEKQRSGTLIPPAEQMKIIGCEQHEIWARDCADKAITLVKDTQRLLPISPGKHRKVLLQILGNFESNKRVWNHISGMLIQEGFEVFPYIKEEFAFDGTMRIETVTQFKAKYDLVIYIGNIENASNKTTNRIDWFTQFGLGNNIPWFVNEVPTLFISVANPYHLLDVPMIKTYINCYSNNKYVLDAVMNKVLGKSFFKGKNPIDPFCGKESLRY